jgi:predicted transcriptional regulator
MSKTKSFPFSMTLRISCQMVDDLQDIASTLRLSRSTLIRRLLQSGIQQSLRIGCAEQAL